MIEILGYILYLALCYLAGYILGIVLAEAINGWIARGMLLNG